MRQADALAVLKTGQNVFLTGEPGAGKSHTVQAYVTYLRAHGVGVAVTASTGIAATHIGGMTIHSFSGIGIAKTLSPVEIKEIAGRDKVAKRIRDTAVLVIDEISMLDGRMLSLVDHVCRAVRQSPLPFGGMQVVLVGDFFQLPPVARDGEYVQFAFDGDAWRAAQPATCYLSEQHRQEDPAFLQLLAALRSGTIDDDHLAMLHARHTQVAGDMTKLFSHNADVDRINHHELARLPGKTWSFTMRMYGAHPLVEQLMRGCLSPEQLALKVGAKVMFTKNNPELGVVNGTTGIVDGVQKESGFPMVRLRNGRVVTAEPMDWSFVVDGRPLASIVQLPLRLAWAITVHKSQGMSLDAAFVDLSGAFAYGQGYVALSRVRSLAGLHLGGLNARALEVDPAVLVRDAEFRNASLSAEAFLSAVSADELTARHERFLVAAGGEVYAVNASPRPRTPVRKALPHEQTVALIASGKTVAEVAQLRGRTTGTIIDHLEKAAASKKLPYDDIHHIFPEPPSVLAAIHAAIAKLGFDKMKPVYEHFEGKYSYETLRIAHIFFGKGRR